MASEAKYNEYFGFTDSEVDQLYEKYTRNTRDSYFKRRFERMVLMVIRQNQERECIIQDL